MNDAPALTIRPATIVDVPVILQFIKELAAYEKLTHMVVATEDLLRQTLFGARPAAEILIGCADAQPVGFALFFHNFSTFLGRPGLYLEDLYIQPALRGQGLGRQLLQRLAQIAQERQCGRLEWAVLDWNAPAIRFYRGLGAQMLDDWRICRLTGATLADFANQTL